MQEQKQPFYGADVGEFTPAQLRKLAELMEIKELQFNPVQIVKLEEMGYYADPNTGTFYADNGVSCIPVGNIADLPMSVKTIPLVVIDPRRQMPEEETLINFAVELSDGEIEYCLGMYNDMIQNMWTDYSAYEGASYITASVLWWWPLPELPGRG